MENSAAGDSALGRPAVAVVDAGAEADFEHGVPRMVTIAGKEVGVIRWGDRYFAVRNHCPDQGGPLCAGPVRSLLAAGPADEHVQLSLDEDRPVIACPWHHYEFDLQTGHEVRGGRRAITYRVDVDEGRVHVRTARPTS